MANKIYVGNLPWSTTSATLEELFRAHGAVRSAEVISDRDTGRSRGFGFVEMETDEACAQAIEALNGQEVDGRAITVNEVASALAVRRAVVVAATAVAAAGTAAVAVVVAAAAAQVAPAAAVAAVATAVVVAAAVAAAATAAVVAAAAAETTSRCVR